MTASTYGAIATVNVAADGSVISAGHRSCRDLAAAAGQIRVGKSAVEAAEAAAAR